MALAQRCGQADGSLRARCGKIDAHCNPTAGDQPVRPQHRLQDDLRARQAQTYEWYAVRYRARTRHDVSAPRRECCARSLAHIERDYAMPGID